MTGWRRTAPLDFAVVHPGGPRILDDIAAGLQLDGDRGAGPCATPGPVSPRTGTLAGSAVLDVLSRTFTEPPGHDERGLIIGFGPGFVLAAVRGHWSN